MNITNDILTFEPSDIAQLSVELQTALDAYSAPHPVEVLLSRIVNDAFRRAESKHVNAKVTSLRAALTTAQPADKLAVEALLDQAGAILNVQFLPAIDKP